VDHADVIVVGAGIVGLSAARALAGAGARVLVVDRGRPGAEASAPSPPDLPWLASRTDSIPPWEV
jgi:digeranylgeranylglycerophospholipid reductase